MASREEAQALADRLMGKGSPKEGDAIASLIAGATNRESPEVGDADEQEIPDEGDDNQDDLDSDADEGDEAEEQLDSADDEEGDGDLDDDQRGEPDSYDYDENDIIEVTVDGVTRDVTLRELVQNFSGEGAISKRLKEATDKLRAADERAVVVENEVQQKYATLLQTVQSLDAVIFEPLASKPNPKLRATNMQQYLMEQDAYDEDQKRIAASRDALQKALAHQKQQLDNARQQFRAQENQKLFERLPDLNDQAKAQQINQDLLETAAHYGFTPEQVADVDLHGIILMALDAGKWLKLEQARNAGKGKSPKGGDSQAEVQVGRRLKKLRAGGVASIKASAQKKATVRKETAAKARESGNVNDVADFLLASASTRDKRGKRNGR